MEKQLETLIRKTLLDLSANLTEKQKLLFQRMYGNRNESFETTINRMDSDKLDFAYAQIQNTLNK